MSTASCYDTFVWVERRASVASLWGIAVLSTQAEAKTLQTKRDALLKNRDELQRLSQQRDSLQARDSAAMAAQPRSNDAGNTSPNHELKNSLDGLLSAIVEEVMQLNESVESLSSQIGIYQKGLSSLEVLRRKAQGELISGDDLSEDSGKLAFQLFDVYMNCISLYRQKVMAVHRLEERRKRQRRRSSVVRTSDSIVQLCALLAFCGK